MNYNNSTCTISILTLRIFKLITSYTLLLSPLFICSSCRQNKSLPNLNNCDRIDIYYSGEKMYYIIPSTSIMNVLSQKEKEYIQSIEYFR